MGILDDMLKNVLPKLNDINGMNFDAVNGLYKINVECESTRKDFEIKTDGDIILLHSVEDQKENGKMLLTELNILVKYSGIMFQYFWTEYGKITPRAYGGVVLPNIKTTIYCDYNAVYGKSVKKGDLLGFGIFMPIIPINFINLINKGA